MKRFWVIFSVLAFLIFSAGLDMSEGRKKVLLHLPWPPTTEVCFIFSGGCRQFQNKRRRYGLDLNFCRPRYAHDTGAGLFYGGMVRTRMFWVRSCKASWLSP